MPKDDITVYGAHWCPDCRRSKQFLGEHQIPYNWVDIEDDPEAEKFVIEKNDGKRIIPTIVFADETFLVEPTNAELATKLGLRTKASRSHYDLIVLGGGPAGLTAALYTAREAIDTLVIERAAFGGQDSKLTQLRVINNQTGAEENIQMDGAFIFIGLVPNTGFIENSNILLDRWGFIVTGHALLHGNQRPTGFTDRDPFLLETSVPGIFAAGDVRDTSTKQVVSAAGEGSTAALLVREYLKTV